MPSKSPLKDLAHQVFRNLLSVSEEILLFLLMVTAAVFVYAPVALALIAVSAAAVSIVVSLISLWQAFAAERYEAILSRLPALERATEVVFAGIAYLALLFALNVLIAGLMRQGRRRFDLVPGLVLSIAAFLAYTISSYLLIQELAAATSWGQLPFLIFFGYLGTNAASLGFLTTDLRPATGKLRREAPRGRFFGTSGGTTAVLILAPESEAVPAAETAKLAAGETRPGVPAGDPSSV